MTIATLGECRAEALMSTKIVGFKLRSPERQIVVIQVAISEVLEQSKFPTELTSL